MALSLPFKTLTMQKFLKTSGLGLTVLITGIHHHQGELVTTQTAHRIGFARLLDQNPDHSPQGLVTGGMAVTVIQWFEIVEVHIEQDRWLLVTLAIGHLARQHIHKAPTVQSGRQDIMIRQRLGLFQSLTQSLDIETQALDFRPKDDRVLIFNPAQIGQSGTAKRASRRQFSSFRVARSVADATRLL